MARLLVFNAAIWSGVNLDAGITIKASSSIQTETPAVRSSASKVLQSECVTGRGLRFWLVGLHGRMVTHGVSVRFTYIFFS